MKYIDPFIVIHEIISKLAKRLTYLYKNDQRNTDEFRYLTTLIHELEIMSLEKE